MFINLRKEIVSTIPYVSGIIGDIRVSYKNNQVIVESCLNEEALVIYKEACEHFKTNLIDKRTSIYSFTEDTKKFKEAEYYVSFIFRRFSKIVSDYYEENKKVKDFFNTLTSLGYESSRIENHTERKGNNRSLSKRKEL